MDRTEFSKIVIALSTALPRYAPNFSDKMVLALWHQNLSDYTVDQLRFAASHVMRNMDTFPSLAVIRRIIESQGYDSPDEIGTEIAARIEKAISRFGYCRSGDAMDYLGELGERVVQMMGGWQAVCDVTTNELPSFRKKARDLAQIVFKKQIDGRGEKPPALPNTLKNAVAIASGEKKENENV